MHSTSKSKSSLTSPRVEILYNPNSTGSSESNAKELARELRDNKITVKIRKTTHAGHGGEIAAAYAKQDKEIILISSSGDGGYHEVVNGALAYKTTKLVVGVLPSGNANDHYSAIGSDSLVDSIIKRKFRLIDTIKVSSQVKGKDFTRFAHSYVGMGVSALAAKSLTEDRPNIFTEKWIVARSFASFDYAKIKEGNKVRRYSSILFSNIDTMSKVLTLSDNASETDGKFEMSKVRFRSKLRLFLYLLKAATFGLKNVQSLSCYECVTMRTLPIQIDGEVYVFDASSKVLIESMHKNLKCVL